MFGKTKGGAEDRGAPSMPRTERPAMAPPAPRDPLAQASPEATSSISSGTSIVGKIVSDGAVNIFGRVEGELRASTIHISDGAEVEGDVVAEEVTIGGSVKGTIHATRVKLNSTAVVEGDIFHQLLAIEEHARFEGSSRRENNVIDTPRLALSRPPAPPQVAANDSGRKPNGAPGKDEHATPAAE
jgi:cytoskeletal protein CcmA (bactofilin family)